MAWETSKEELVIEAKTKEQLGPELNRRGGKGDQKKETVRYRPHVHELTAGQIYSVNRFPKHTEGFNKEEEPWQFWGGANDQWERARGFAKELLGNDSWLYDVRFRVRLVCTPLKNQKYCLVERCFDRKLAVIHVEDLWFAYAGNWSERDIYLI